MKKIFTHWTIGLLTLAILTFIGLGDPQVKEILRLKSFDFLFQSETKELSEDIGDKWYKLNDEYAQKWPQITKKKDAYPEAKKYAEEENKLEKYGLEEE